MTNNNLAKYSVETDSRWLDVKNKNRDADGQFVYAVKTTGIYCHPSCPAKTAKFQNIEFFNHWQQAEKAGYRACKRCRPNNDSITSQHEHLITHACRSIEEHLGDIKLSELATNAGMSIYHFHRQFKKITGVTPKQYSVAIRIKNMRQELTAPEEKITNALYNSGFNSGSRFYAATNEALGMTPTAFRQGAPNTFIQFAVAQCSLGSILVACSSKGICAIMLGDDPSILLNELQDKFPKAELIGGDSDFDQVVAQAIGLIENPNHPFNLPLDIQGTAFQQRVWQALRNIPVGNTINYTQLAEMIGLPKSVRAVANACAQNVIAVAIPCHRVVKLNGDISGYRWGIDRKRALILREKKEWR